MPALGFVTVLVRNTHFSWWAMIIGIVIPCVWVVSIGIIFATTNIQIGLNVIIEFIIGYMLPERPLVMIMFKSYGMLSFSQRY